MIKKLLRVFCFFLLLGTGGGICAQANLIPSDSYQRQKQKSAEYDDLDDDPLEIINRKVFAFNEVVDGVLLDPFANMYRMGMPDDAQIMISNILHNTAEPLIFLNDCLQAKKNKALESFCRFFINTVFGLFGLFDVAKHLGLEPHQENFNTTLKYWGVPQGPYIVLPIIGPANPRYITGWLADYFIDPINLYAHQHNKDSLIYWRSGLQILTARANITEDIKNFRENSLDFYAAIRSFYKQYMDASHMDGKVAYSSPSLDEFMFDDDMEPHAANH